MGIDRKMEDILKSCDRRMLRYMVRVRWQDRIPSKEVAINEMWFGNDTG